jgi:hypothetical protein
VLSPATISTPTDARLGACHRGTARDLPVHLSPALPSIAARSHPGILFLRPCGTLARRAEQRSKRMHFISTRRDIGYANMMSLYKTSVNIIMLK